MSSTRYFHIRNGVEQGPFLASQLKQLAQTGRIAPDDLVRADGRDKLYPAQSVVGLFTPEQLAGTTPNSVPPLRTNPGAESYSTAPPKNTVLPSNDSPLVALMAALVSAQRESLNDRVMQGRMTMAERDRQCAELATLLGRVREEFVAPVESVPFDVTPGMPAAGVSAFSAAASVGSAVLAGGILGVAATRNVAAREEAPASSISSPQSPDPFASINIATKAIDALRGLHNSISKAFTPATSVPNHSSIAANLPPEVMNQLPPHNSSPTYLPVPDPTSAPSTDYFGSSTPSQGPIWSNPAAPVGYESGSGGDWGGLSDSGQTTHGIAASTAHDSGSGDFFSAIFGTPDTTAGNNISEVADASTNWLGGTDTASGLVDNTTNFGDTTGGYDSGSGFGF